MGRTWTEEEKKAFAEKMKRLREEKKVQPESPKTVAADPAPTPETILDLTGDKNFATEDEFVRWIHWEFDDGRMPSVIKITSHQALTLAAFTKVVPVRGYNSPFGSHRIQIVPGKEVEAQNVEEEK